MNFSKKEMFPPNEAVNYSDLDKAHTLLEEVKKTGNKEREAIVSAHFDSIEMSLKKLEAIPTSPEEEVSFELDKLFPKAKNYEVVSFGEEKYQLFFILVGHDLGKRVWKREWRLMIDPSNEKKKELFPDNGVSIDFYHELQSDLEHLIDAQKNDDSDKASWLGRSARRSNRIQEVSGLIYKAEISLKKRSLLPSNEYEQLSFELDKLGGNLKNKEVVEYHGKCYQLQFFSLAESNSGKTVKVWGRDWVEVVKP